MIILSFHSTLIFKVVLVIVRFGLIFQEAQRCLFFFVFTSGLPIGNPEPYFVRLIELRIDEI